jgi:hypothetical protein
MSTTPLDHIQNFIFTDTALLITLISFDIAVSMPPVSFDSELPLTPRSHKRSGVLSDLKLEYLGEFTTVFENFLGCKATYFRRSWMQLNKRIAIVPFNILCRQEILEPLKRIKKSHTKYKRLLLNTKVSNLTIKFRKLKWITMQWHDWLGGGRGGDGLMESRLTQP